MLKVLQEKEIIILYGWIKICILVDTLLSVGFEFINFIYYPVCI